MTRAAELADRNLIDLKNLKAPRSKMNYNNQPFKRPMTLELNNPTTKKFYPFGAPAPVLSTPDMVLLQVASPELENMIRNGGSLQVLTPNMFPSKVSFLNFLTFNNLKICSWNEKKKYLLANKFLINVIIYLKVTNEQEDYAKGFMNALSSLHSTRNPHQQVPIPNPSMSGGGFNYNNYSFSQISQNHQQQRQDDFEGSSNDGNQEDKLDKKRMMNRLAAAKCRLKKMDKIEKLRDKVNILRGETKELDLVALSLREQVKKLKGEVFGHISYGCVLDQYRQ